MTIYKTIRPIIFSLDPEDAHRISLKILKTGMVPSFPNDKFPKLKINVAGIEFPNPLGLAAGYDKNGVVAKEIIELGFSHMEVGTVTPKAQVGNKKPRVFRLEKEKGIINQFGFNNHGSKIVKENIKNNKNKIIGVNIGANKNTKEFIDDYKKGIETFKKNAQYITINISSPNTENLRDMQNKNQLNELVKQIENSRIKIPVFVKIAPDLNRKQINEICKIIKKSNVSGVIVSNTTIRRNTLPETSKHKNVKGGLSGAPLFEMSTQVLANVYRLIGDKVPIIGVGGINSGETAWKKIEAGASLIQLYSGLVYEGPKLVKQILTELNEKLEDENVESIKDIVGRKAHKFKKLDE